jgi:hypothetical protein
MWMQACPLLPHVPWWVWLLCGVLMLCWAQLPLRLHELCTRSDVAPKDDLVNGGKQWCPPSSSGCGVLAPSVAAPPATGAFFLRFRFLLALSAAGLAVGSGAGAAGTFSQHAHTQSHAMRYATHIPDVGIESLASMCLGFSFLALAVSFFLGVFNAPATGAATIRESVDRFTVVPVFAVKK